jgi:hypothetical protein
MLRGLAVKQQKDHPQVFLSLREAARRFGVPVSAMATVYRQLNAEGVLVTVRGSYTILQKRGALRQLKVRGLIGMPVSISRFQVLQDYRRCFSQLRDELHERGFLTSTIFFEQPAGQPHVVINQFKKEKVDAVIWLLPDTANVETVLRLRDLGIAFVGLNITPLTGIQCRYQVRREPAIRTIIRSWRDDPAIEKTTILRVGRETSSDQERLAKLRTLIESERLDCNITTVPSAQIPALLQTICEDRPTGIILPSPAAALLGWHASEALLDVFRSCRLALIDGLIDLPYVDGLPRAKVDLVTVSWPAIIRQIVAEMLTGEAFNGHDTVVFNAKAHLRVPLSDYVHPPKEAAVTPLSH